MAFGGSLKQVIASGAGLGLMLYLLFDKLLDIVLPTGILSFLLGGR
jgi:putative tricarboxylic transport membrane protein